VSSLADQSAFIAAGQWAFMANAFQKAPRGRCSTRPLGFDAAPAHEGLGLPARAARVHPRRSRGGRSGGDLERESLVEPIQQRCHVEEAEPGVVSVESQPSLGASMDWRVTDAGRGRIPRGRTRIDAKLDLQPGPEGETAATFQAGLAAGADTSSRAGGERGDSRRYPPGRSRGSAPRGDRIRSEAGTGMRPAPRSPGIPS
jgi:hypothetical protein